MWISAGSFFSVALSAHRSIPPEHADRAFLPNEIGHLPLIAVVFGVASLECFINEIGELSLQQSIPRHPAEVETLGALLKEADESRLSLELKFHLARLALTGQKYDPGTQPYQDFKLLLNLRNWLAHPRPEESEVPPPGANRPATPPTRLEGLRSRNVLAEFPLDSSPHQLLWVRTRAVSRWSCTTVSQMVGSIVEATSPGSLRESMELFYQVFFEPVI